MAGTAIPTKRGIPGVYKLENDISLVISPQVSLNVAAVLEAEQGLANEPTIITSQTQLVDSFGEPTDDNYDDWFNIAQVFQYNVQGLGGVVLVNRVLGDDCKNDFITAGPSGSATGTNSNVLIRNTKDAESFDPVFAGDASLMIYNNAPSSKKLKVAIGSFADFSNAEVYQGVKFEDNVEFEPENESQFYIFVLDEGDNILEKFLVSMNPKDLDERTGLSLGLETQINNRSKYILAYAKPDETVAPKSTVATELGGGVYNKPTREQLNAGYNIFSSTNKYSIQYILGSIEAYDAMNQLAYDRDDCSFRTSVRVGDLLGKEEFDAINDLKDTYKGLASTSRGSVISQVKMISDIYSGKKRWISCGGDAIGLRIRQNLSKEPWWSDGGYNYGILNNVIKVAQEWSPLGVRELIKARFNPIILDNNVGYVKIEQHNFTAKNSALRDENVRELINYIYRAAKVFLKYKLHEFNDEITRYDVSTKMKRFMANVQAGRGIRHKEDGSDGYVVICDSTNNTDEVINQNLLVIDLSMLPARSIVEVWLRVNIAANGVQLEIN